jgi:hypothetical protein
LCLAKDCGEINLNYPTASFRALPARKLITKAFQAPGFRRHAVRRFLISASKPRSEGR